MRCSTFTAITRPNKPDTSDIETEWRANILLGQSQNGQNRRFSNFPYRHERAITKFENARRQTPGG